MKYKNASIEVIKLKDRGYLIAEYDEFESAYISTDRQVSIGSKIMILIELNSIKSMRELVAPFTNEQDLCIIENVTNLDCSWGLIFLKLNMPEKISISQCPDWISWKYVELVGGLRLKSQEYTNTFLRFCPPLIRINSQITTDMVSILNENGEKIQFNINGSDINVNNVDNNRFVIYVNKQPQLAFNLIDPELYQEPVEKELEYCWKFDNMWPHITQFSKTISSNILWGVSIRGNWDKQDAQREWLMIHSGLSESTENNINKLLINWSVNAVR
jgi:hypothetical protein